MDAILHAVGTLATLGAEYATASEQRREAIREEAESAYRDYKAGLAGLPAAIAENDRVADAAAEALPNP